MLPKISVTATGMTTNGSRTLIRQRVLLRRLVSRAAAIAVAKISCGTAETRKMLSVFRRATQNWRCWTTNAKLSRPVQRPSPPRRSQACSDTQAV